MAGSFDGKVALVTGASSGMGKSTAIAFGRESAQVVVAARRRPEGEETVRIIRDGGGEAIFIQTDVTQPDQVEAMVEGAVKEYARLDVAFNNAGGFPGGTFNVPVHELSVDDYGQFDAIFLKSVWLCMKYEITQMLKQDGGAIVNNSSIFGLKGAKAGPLYSAMKHGVIGLTKSAALQYGPSNIRVNALCPGWIDTEMTAGWLDDSDISSSVLSMQALKRHGEGDEIPGMVLYLCSDSASFTTGASFVVDGGLLA